VTTSAVVAAAGGGILVVVGLSIGTHERLTLTLRVQRRVERVPFIVSNLGLLRGGASVLSCSAAMPG
jgi:hypothetical protein